MARTEKPLILETFTGIPILTDKKVQQFKDWYRGAIEDYNGTYNNRSRSTYSAQAEMLNIVLRVLHESE